MKARQTLYFWTGASKAIPGPTWDVEQVIRDMKMCNGKQVVMA